MVAVAVRITANRSQPTRDFGTTVIQPTPIARTLAEPATNRTISPLRGYAVVFQQPHQVVAVAALAQRLGEGGELSGGQPARQPASSTQPILWPCRSSMTRTNSAACISESNVPVSSHAVPRSSTVHRAARPRSQVALVDRGDLQLAARARASIAWRSRRRRCRRSTGRAPRSCYFGCAGFSSIDSTRAVVVELHDAVRAAGWPPGRRRSARRRVARCSRSCRPRPAP